MPNTRIIDEWKGGIYEIKANYPRYGPDRILAKLKEREPDRTDYPSSRTVGRALKDFQDMQPEEQDQYRYFYWPETMEAGTLPWEASRSALELLGHMEDIGPRGGRPTIRYVKWFWRLTQVAPDASIQERREFAAYLGLSDALRGSGSPAEKFVPTVLRGVERRLAHPGQEDHGPKGGFEIDSLDTEGMKAFREFFVGIYLGRFQ